VWRERFRSRDAATVALPSILATVKENGIGGLHAPDRSGGR
jgi:hypothetical protein